MPIRDMDMYATWQRQQSHSNASTSYNNSTSSARVSQGVLDDGVGVPVGSNRGASGIDGVLSTAAGFAAGLKRSVTLTVGDVSFLHDINGLNLLRTGSCVSLQSPPRRRIHHAVVTYSVVYYNGCACTWSVPSVDTCWLFCSWLLVLFVGRSYDRPLQRCRP